MHCQRKLTVKPNEPTPRGNIDAGLQVVSPVRGKMSGLYLNRVYGDRPVYFAYFKRKTNLPLLPREVLTRFPNSHIAAPAIICPASTHTALVSSPSLAVLHLPTYIHAMHEQNLVCGAPTHYLESTAFGAMISVPHWTFFVVERIKESFCSGRQLHHSPLLQSALYTQVLLLSV